MKTLAKLFSAAALLVAAVVPAFADNTAVIGRWKSSTGESQYDVSLCGNGSQLCAKLVWLSPDVRNDETEPYLGTYLIKNAQPVADGTWQGEVHLFENTLGGTVTLVNRKTISLEGCYFVFCKSFKLKKMN